jgi:hypothetical protein
MDSLDCLRGVNGEGVMGAFDASFVVRLRGEGVRGMRPPAVRVEKMP